MTVGLRSAWLGDGLYSARALRWPAGIETQPVSITPAIASTHKRDIDLLRLGKRIKNAQIVCVKLWRDVGAIVAAAEAHAERAQRRRTIIE